MSARLRVLRGMVIRRAVTAQRRLTRLTRAQVHPFSADLYAFLAHMSRWSFDRRNRLNVIAGFFCHGSALYSLTASSNECNAILKRSLTSTHSMLSPSRERECYRDFSMKATSCGMT